METLNESDRSAALWLLLANDTHLSQFVTDADRLLFKRRLGAEGIGFLTNSLPALGKALDTSFQTGIFKCPKEWRTAKGRAYPAFLHKAFQILFNDEGIGVWVSQTQALRDTVLLMDGEIDGLHLEFVPNGLLSEGAAIAVHCIRQLTMAFYKYEQPWTKDQAEATYTAFEKAEDELWDTTKGLLEGGLDRVIDGLPLRTYLERAERLITRLLKGVDPMRIDPCYGTGATAEKSTPWGRWEKPRFIPRLDAVYSVSEWYFSGIDGLDAAMRSSRLDLEECADPLARVVLVPKDSRGPRLISAEPREFMYIQQGLMKAMVGAMESYPNVKAQVSTIDQSRNRWLACFASETGSHASLDLKEASDRVSWWLVTKIFPEIWVECLGSCRSESTVLPTGVEIPLTKFAPMGSACCFPVEALCFWALANAAKKTWSESRFKAMFSRSTLARKRCSLPGLVSLDPAQAELNSVCVFGDDIIVPTHDVEVTIAVIEAVGLLVNRHKSYTQGPFRESCGGDYYRGIDVAPVRVKSRLDSDSIGCMLRVKDVLNRISLIYGATCPSLVIQCRNLFREFFGLELPIASVNHRDGTPGLVLIDYYWGVREDGSTLSIRKDRRTKRTIVSIIKARRRCDNPNKLQCNYGYSQIRVATEVADEVTRDLNWSSVLRSFHVSGGRGGADKYALRKRVVYKTAWLTI